MVRCLFVKQCKVNVSLASVIIIISFAASTAFIIYIDGMAFAVRLVGGPSSQEGRLELNYNGVWGTVCNHEFTDTEATVVCRSLGFTYVLYTCDFVCSVI